MRTVAEPVEGTEVRVEPADSPGITINEIPVTLDNARTLFRVDLAADDNRAFIVEHILSVLGMHGITAAAVHGVRTEWDFARPEHRFARSIGLTPGSVIGHPKGLHDPVVEEGIRTTDIVERGDEPRQTLSAPVEYGDGAIRIAPREQGRGLLIRNHVGEETITFDIDPRSRSDTSDVKLISTSTTPFLGGTAREGDIHWVGDLVSDIGLIGGFDDAVVDSYSAGHGDTIGVSRKAFEQDKVVERTV